jgi:hypothetical protein
MIPKMILCRTVMGERSMIATGGRSLSVRMKLTSLSCSLIATAQTLRRGIIGCERESGDA